MDERGEPLLTNNFYLLITKLSKMNTQISSYEQQGIDFLTTNKIEFSTKFIGHDTHLEYDKEERDRFKCSFIKREYPIKRLEIKFGQSIASSTGNGGEKPTAYDVLACITKYDPGTFNNFCSEFGYDEDSRKAEKIYNAIQKEWQQVCAFFTPEEIEQMQEIQ